MCEKCLKHGRALVSEYSLRMKRLKTKKSKNALRKLADDDAEAAGKGTCNCPVRGCESHCYQCV